LAYMPRIRKPSRSLSWVLSEGKLADEYRIAITDKLKLRAPNRRMLTRTIGQSSSCHGVTIKGEGE
jgi:hypothetical protein